MVLSWKAERRRGERGLFPPQRSPSPQPLLRRARGLGRKQLHEPTSGTGKGRRRTDPLPGPDPGSAPCHDLPLEPAPRCGTPGDPQLPGWLLGGVPVQGSGTPGLVAVAFGDVSKWGMQPSCPLTSRAWMRGAGEMAGPAWHLPVTSSSSPGAPSLCNPTLTHPSPSSSSPGAIRQRLPHAQSLGQL